jgi:osmoprotectant transport system ATP-binding protein
MGAAPRLKGAVRVLAAVGTTRIIRYGTLYPPMPPPSDPPPRIEFRNVSYSTPQTAILRGLSLEVPPGETVVLLGRSGSGKTTTLKLINRLLEPSSGEVSVGGKSTLRWDPITLRRQVGYVIQEVGLFPHFTIEENVALVPSLENWPRERIVERVREMLTLVGLPPGEFGARYPDQLSGGQRQRVGVARALAGEPRIVLLDEPFGALDPITRREIRQEFRELGQRLEVTIVFVTHDVGEAFALADRIALMKDGALEAYLPPGEFRGLDTPEARLFLEALNG